MAEAEVISRAAAFRISQRAQAAVGDPAARDWVLDPADHARNLANAQAAGVLPRILTREKVAELSRAFDRADKSAIKQQRLFSVISMAAAYCALVAALAGVVGELFRVNTVWVQIGALLITLVLPLLAPQSLLRSWLHKRAEAEGYRHAFFRYVVNTQEEAFQSELPEAAVKLEYFLRFFLNPQIGYFSKRGQAHRSESGWRQWKRLGVFVAAAGVVLWLLYLWWFTAQSDASKASLNSGVLLVVVGVVAVQGFLSQQAVITLSDRTGERYLLLEGRLRRLTGKPLEQARQAAAGGDNAAVQSFAQMVFQELDAEQREWRSESEMENSL